MSYIDPEVIDDEVQVAEAILAGIADRIPGWEPSEGSPETAMGEAIAVVAATIASLLKEEERNNYAGFGERILGLERRAASVATAHSRWTLSDNPEGYTIPAGSELVMESPVTGEPVAFATLGDTIVPPGQLVADEVTVAALEPGEAANGCVGGAVEWDDLPLVSSVELTTVSAGGSEEEPLEEYVQRVADRARRIRAVPVTADDFAALALDIPGVARACAVNLLDPNDPPDPQDPPQSEGHITVFPVDEQGQPISGGTLAQLQAAYNTEDRPLNVQVHIAEPTYTDLEVEVTIRVAPGYAPEDVAAQAEAAIRNYLDPAVYGRNDTAPGRWRLPDPEDRVVREYDIATVVDVLDGVARIVSVTINGGEEATLEGWAPLPRVTDVTVTVA